LPVSLALTSPHPRRSHQNDKTEAAKSQRRSKKYQEKHRTSSHYSEVRKEALRGEKLRTSLKTQITMESKLLSIRQEGLWLSTSGNSYQHAIFFKDQPVLSYLVLE